MTEVIRAFSAVYVAFLCLCSQTYLSGNDTNTDNNQEKVPIQMR